MNHDIGCEFSVFASLEYRYIISGPHDLQLTYEENGRNDKPYITFADADEMESVAKAMLKVVEIARETK